MALDITFEAFILGRNHAQWGIIVGHYCVTDGAISFLALPHIFVARCRPLPPHEALMRRIIGVFPTKLDVSWPLVRSQ